MRVEIRYFASLKDRAGTARDELDLPERATVQVAVARALEVHPKLVPLRAVRFARNAELCEPEELLADGDEVALLPPVSGG